MKETLTHNISAFVFSGNFRIWQLYRIIQLIMSLYKSNLSRFVAPFNINAACSYNLILHDKGEWLSIVKKYLHSALDISKIICIVNCLSIEIYKFAFFHCLKKKKHAQFVITDFSLVVIFILHLCNILIEYIMNMSKFVSLKKDLCIIKYWLKQ